MLANGTGQIGKGTIVVVVGLFLFMTIVGVMANFYTWKALRFHADFAYFIEFSSRLSDANLSNQLSINPSGSNWIGWHGTEGVSSMHQWIHLESIKYIYSLAYFVWPTPVAIFVLISAIYFLPILYLGFFMPLHSRVEKLFKWTIIGIYSLYPSVLAIVSFDARPYILLIPTWFLAYLAIQWRRPVVEVMLAFNLMFLVREESLVLGAVLVLYVFVLGNKYRKYLKPIMYSWLVWLILTLQYFNWTGYVLQRTPGSVLSRVVEIAFLPPVIISLITSLILAIVLAFKYRRLIQEYLPLLVFSLVLIPVFLPFGSAYYGIHYKTALERLLYSPRWMLNVVCVLMVIMVWWYHLRSSKARAMMVTGLSLWLILFSVLTVFFEQSSWRMAMRYAHGSSQIQWLFDFKEQLDGYEDVVLADSVTINLLTSFESAYSYESMPWRMVPGDARNYPSNAEVTKNLLRDSVDYVMVLNSNIKNVLEMVEAAGINGDMREEIGSDERFTVMKIRR